MHVEIMHLHKDLADKIYKIHTEVDKCHIFTLVLSHGPHRYRSNMSALTTGTESWERRWGSSQPRKQSIKL